MSFFLLSLSRNVLFVYNNIVISYPVLFPLSSLFYFGCCYLRAELYNNNYYICFIIIIIVIIIIIIIVSFNPVLSLLGSQSYLGCCYLKNRAFTLFY